LPALRDRALLVAGEHDPYLAPDVPRALTAIAEQHPGVRTEMVEGAGHWVAYEAPERLNAMLLEAAGART
jgi:pimeloyl-ACP methyl ester carboxylesterase